ncbi:MAG: MATE family efflux transporter [Candidatus Marinimicrobia bacterium]|nr:MATE family efflux transporter [Candidatus Neomarinimicrobiota bacterium]
MSEVLLKNREHTPGGIWEMLAIALPMIISFAANTVMTFTDRMFLSRLGPEVMNAAMGGGLTAFMMSTFFLGLIGYSTALVAQYLGANRKSSCPTVTTQALMIALLAYPIVLLAKPLAIKFFDVMHVPAAQLEYQIIYFNILIYGAIIGLIRTVFSSYFSGIGRTKVVMIAGILMMLVNVGVNYVLIFGKLGFPAMGIRGAAYGTIIGGVSGLLVLFVAYFGKKNREEFHVMKSFHYYRQIMKKLLKFGYPPGLEFLLNLFAFNLMILIFHSMGDVIATATTIMFNWDNVSYIPLIGIEIAVTSLVGRYMGAQKIDIASKAAISAFKTGLMYSAVILGLFIFLPQQLVNVFRPTGESAIFEQAVPTAVYMLRIAGFYVLVEAAIVTFVGVLRGAGDTRWSMIASVTLHYIMVIGLYLVVKVFNMSAEVGWLVVVSVFMMFSVVFYLRFRGGKWKEIKMVEANIPEA